MNRSSLALVVLGAFVFASACDNSFVKGWRVDRTRVLGARIEAATDSTRASLAVGEAARLRWLVGAPNGVGRLEWAFALCAPPPGNVPDPRCEGPVLASGTGTSEGEVAVMDIALPAAGVAGDPQELLALAAFCEAGRPVLDAATFTATCGVDVKPLLASATIRMAVTGANKNPEIADDAVLFDGAPLPPATTRPTGPPCAQSPASPVVGAGSAHTFVIGLRGDEREPIGAGGLETLIVSHVATAGELDRQYSSLEPGEAPAPIAIPWTAPPREEVGENGRLAELFFVLRDGRTGAAFARRSICVRRDP